MSNTAYRIIFKTGTKGGAGTDSNIDVSLNSSKGSSGYIRINPYIKRNAFENGQTDVVVLSLENIGDIESISLKSDGKYLGSDWFLEYIQVVSSEYVTTKFNVNNWIKKGTYNYYAKPSKIDRSLKPVYIIGHRCNNKGDTENSLKQGVNGVEIDIQYDNSKNKFFVNHDRCSGLTIEDWLNEALGVVVNYHYAFAMIYFDLKGDAPQNLDKFINIIHNHAISRMSMNFIYSISTINQAPSNYASCFSSLSVREGYCVDYEEDVAKVSDFFKRNRITRCWYGYGIYAGGSFSNSIKNTLKKANADCRGTTEGKVQKTATWTYELKSSALTLLKSEEPYNVDTIIVNSGGGDVPRTYTYNIVEAFHELDSYLRLATREDNLFAYAKEWY